MASHGGGDYIREQSASPDQSNQPGIICYVKKGNEVYKKNSSPFGPGDLFCSQWHILSLAGIDTDTWTPQYNYWQRPGTLEDGGKNIR